MRALPLVVPLLLVPALAGCSAPPEESDGAGYREMGFDGKTWPDLHGAKVTVLAYESFAPGFAEHARAFANLTNGTVELVTAPDSGAVLERAAREKGDPTFDVVYGVDNVLYGRALREGVFEPYEPALASRIDPALVFDAEWRATPVTHGFVAVNADPRAGLDVRTLDDVREHASRFVTEDPRTSTPGLGFLVATVATYGEDDEYDYLDYWRDLLDGGALVVADWTSAYAGRFTGGFGQFETGARVDKPIVTSYTTSPAYEAFYGYETLNEVVLAPDATFHQVQVMGVAAGAENRAAAQAWIEYCLTDAFQSTVAENEAVYPVVASVSVEPVFGGRDPKPGSFEPAPFTHEELDLGVARWLRAWTDVYEASRA